MKPYTKLFKVKVTYSLEFGVKPPDIRVRILDSIDIPVDLLGTWQTLCH